MVKRSAWALPLILAAVVAPAQDGDVESRIARVVNRLLPETSLRGRYRQPARLADRMAFYHTPGVSIAVIRDDRIDWAPGFGLREAGSPEPITTETVFEAGSVSKPVYALLVMRLVQEGKLDLDRDVNENLKSWKVPASGGYAPRLTLRQLLSHSAGLTVYGFPGYLRSEPLPTLAQILSGQSPSNTPAVEVNALPGIAFRYSGGGTTVAQLAVTETLGKPLPQLARALLLEPLGLKDSTYEQPLPESWHHRAATAHPWKGAPVTGQWHVYPEMAAAGPWTTPSDLARIGIELRFSIQGKAGRLLKPELAAQMLTPQLAEQREERAGIGFFLKGDGESIRFEHGGWDEGFVTQMTVYKNQGLGAVIMVNSNEGHPLLREIERAIAREYGWPDYFEKERKAVDLAPAALDALGGEYASPSGRRLEARGSVPPIVARWPASSGARRFI